jgi:hypothetical protein
MSPRAAAERLLLLWELVDAVGEQRDRDRPARRPPGRVDGHVDGVRQPLALAAALAVLAVMGAPHVGVGVGAQVALAVDQHRRDALHQQLLDDAQRQRGLAGTRAAEHGGVALQHVLVERDRAVGAQCPAGQDAPLPVAHLVEQD